MDSELNGGELLLSHKKSGITTVLLYLVIILLLGLVLFFAFIGSAIVDGISMETTFTHEQRVLLMCRGYAIERGDVIVFTAHNKMYNETKPLIKRVIALEGDKILFVKSADGIYVDTYICENKKSYFTLLREDYLHERVRNDDHFNGTAIMQYVSREDIENTNISGTNTNYLKALMLDHAITIKKDAFYFMGDNRNHSTDARNTGYYDASSGNIKNITGKVILAVEKGSALENFLNLLFPAAETHA